jgi:predicted GIY-YIG superfamily endonuclease
MIESAYIIYRLLNTVTGKSYVGMTNGFPRRKLDHFHHLLNNIHHSTKLQNSFNKYGRTAFEWSIVETCVSREDAESAEIKWIAHFDSKRNGYNMTEGGDYNNSHKPCVWNGVEYPSQKEAATALGVSNGTINYRLRRGYTCDSDMPRTTDPKNGYIEVVELKRRPRVSCVWNGIEYPSFTAAAKKLGIGKGTMHYRISRGYTCDEDLNGGLYKIEDDFIGGMFDDFENTGGR